MRSPAPTRHALGARVLGLPGRLRARVRPAAILGVALSAAAGWGAVAASTGFAASALDARARTAPAGLSRLPGLSSLDTGIADDNALLYAAAPVRSMWLSRAQGIGSTWVRLSINWADVVSQTPGPGFRASDPADPNYNWATVDASVRAAVAHRQRVLLGLYHAPAWAEGPNRPGTNLVYPGSWYPSPTAFAAFARAAALRYSGSFPDPLFPGRKLPRIRYFQAWNEPNLPRYLMPQWVRNAGGQILPFAPSWYRTMLNGFYAAVKSVHPDDVVLAAGTGPYGDPPGAAQGRMAPVVFLREFFCLTQALRAAACPGGPPHFDILDHHPYAASPQVKAHSPDDVAVPDLGKIWRVLHFAQRAHHVLPAGSKALWVTELDWATNPPTASNLATQWHYLDLAFYRLWLEHVSAVFWFYISDHPEQINSFSGAGLFLTNGTAKPAAAAFRFPFVAVGTGKAGTIWGKAPLAGSVVIQQLKRGVWRPLLTLPTTSAGIFYARHRLPRHGQVRAVIGTVPSPVWTTS